jgi:hypothetical protein
LKLTVKRIGTGPNGYTLLRIIGEGSDNDVNDIETNDPDDYIAELRAECARAGHTVEVEGDE